MGDEHDRQMADAYRRQREAARRAQEVDRRGWTQDQWVADAKRLMYEPDGAITSLVNGHATYLIAEVDQLRAEVEQLRQGRIESLFARTAPVNVTACPTCGGEGTVRLDG